MNALIIPTTCKLNCAASVENAKITFAASRAVSSLKGMQLESIDSFEAGQLVAVKVVRNNSGKLIRLNDLSTYAPIAGDVLVCLIGANGSFKIEVITVPTAVNEWVVVNRGGLVGQPMFDVGESSLVVSYLGNLVKDNMPVKLTDKLPAEYKFYKPIIAVVGTDTNTGKTVTTAKVISELKQMGLSVGACKLTGICGDDILSYKDAGADELVDFTDAGLPSTICTEETAVNAALKCISSLQNNDVIVAEFGSTLIGGHPVLSILKAFNLSNLKVVVCCSDVPGAIGAMFLLASGANGLRPSLFSGLVANSELACAKVLETTGVPCASAAKFLLRTMIFQGVTNVELC